MPPAEPADGATLAKVELEAIAAMRVHASDCASSTNSAEHTATDAT